MMHREMRAVQVSQAGGPLEVVERDIPVPGRGELRVSVEACGVCHSDSFTIEGMAPGLIYPRIQVMRLLIIDAVGPDLDG
jgi:D-arabinose 1-dehydrogenase-like Zn-dependent alcohol dehydrogenase